MSHLKRQKVPKSWAVPRKGTKYLVKPSSAGIPILVVLRDLLKVAQNKKEVKKAIHERAILINNKPVKDERRGVQLFDTISILPSKKHYRLDLAEKGKFTAAEIKEAEANKKIAKVADKKTLKKKKVQLNLIDGHNFLTDVKCNVGDSVVINFKDKKVEKCLALKEKVKVIVFAGKHAGDKGTLEKLETERKMAKLNIDKHEVNVLIKQLMVVE